MLYSLGIIDQNTIAVSIVHDCQVLEETLHPEKFDTVCDAVVTPTRVIKVKDRAAKPSCGVLWPLLQPGMLESIPPLQDLRDMNIRIA